MLYNVDAKIGNSSPKSLSLDVDLDSLKSKMENGKAQLQMLLEDADTPCWKSNLLSLINNECHSLSYKSRSKIAFQLTNCHLFRSGLSSIPCDFDKNDVTICIKNMTRDSTAFSTYNNFFTHIDNICFFSQIQNRHNIMNDAMIQMYSATIDSAYFLNKMNNNSEKFHNLVIQQQNDIIKNNEIFHQYHELHFQNIGQLKNVTGVLNDQQYKIMANHKQFLNNEENILENVHHMKMQQESLLNNHNQLSNQISSLDKQQNLLQNSIGKSIDMQQQSIEFHNQMQELQKQSIHQLSKSQHELTNHFTKCFEQHNRVLYEQQETINNLDELQEKTTLLQQETIESQNQLKHMYDWQHDILSQTQDQIIHVANFSENAYTQLTSMINKMLTIVDKIFKIDLQIVAEYLSIQSFFFHILWVCIVYFVTIPKFCRAPRFWLFLSVFITFIVERFLINQTIIKLYHDTDWISSRITITTISKMVRQLMIIFNIIIYIYSFINYKDIEAENLVLLSQINNKIYNSPYRTRQVIQWTSSPNRAHIRSQRGFVFQRPKHF